MNWSRRLGVVWKTGVGNRGANWNGVCWNTGWLGNWTTWTSGWAIRTGVWAIRIGAWGMRTGAGATRVIGATGIGATRVMGANGTGATGTGATTGTVVLTAGEASGIPSYLIYWWMNLIKFFDMNAMHSCIFSKWMWWALEIPDVGILWTLLQSNNKQPNWYWFKS